MQAIQNLGLALITMLSGVVVDKMGYLWLETFFIFWLVVALLATVVIWLIDFNGDGYLNMGVKERDDFDEAKRRDGSSGETDGRKTRSLVHERKEERSKLAVF